MHCLHRGANKHSYQPMTDRQDYVSTPAPIQPDNPGRSSSGNNLQEELRVIRISKIISNDLRARILRSPTNIKLLARRHIINTASRTKSAKTPSHSSHSDKELTRTTHSQQARVSSEYSHQAVGAARPRPLSFLP